MRQPSSLHLALVAVFATAAPPASAQVVTINFDGLSNGTVVTNQYPFAVFSSALGMVNRVFGAPFLNGSKPNVLCSGSTAVFTCTEPTYIDFSVPVSGLSFNALGIDDFGRVGLARIFSGSTMLDEIALVGNRQQYDPLLVDFGGTGGITRLELTGIRDPGGIAWDDFKFNAGTSSVSPEPSSVLLVASGLGSIAFGIRRRAFRAGT
jgi:hypothetical protein